MVACIASTLGLIFHAPVSAQTIPCPDLDENASAAEQALCWFNSNKGARAYCMFNKGEKNPCIEQVNAWCANASLDENIVTTACLLAAIRSGDLKEAKEVAKYLRSPSRTAAVCAKALQRARIRILSNPAGAEVVIDGRSYGKAPVEVTLVGNWWESQVDAVFSSGGTIVRTEVSNADLRNTLNKQECVFGDLVISGPHQALPLNARRSVSLETNKRGKPGTTENPPNSQQSASYASYQRSTTSVWATISLAGLGALSTGIAVGFYVEKRDKWANILLITGGACLVGAVVLYLWDSGKKGENSAITLTLAPTAISLRSRF